VPPDRSVNDIVLFELPSPFLATRLVEHVGCERFAWQLFEHWVPIVAVVLMAEELDLAHLLRSVQSWLALRGLESIHYDVDGRSYVLSPRALAAAG